MLAFIRSSRFIALLSLFLFPALAGTAAAAAPTVERAPYGETAGKKVELFTLKNDSGMTIKLIGYGAAIAELHVPDRKGESGNVVLGLRDLASYVRAGAHFGATVGRYGNRIANAKFELDGTTYTLNVNNGKNTLHGGKIGFEKVCWTGEPVKEEGRAGVRFEYISPDGDENYPGELKATVTYWLSEKSNDLQIDYAATTTKPTVVNLTNHSYFNLGGETAGPITTESLTLDAPFYLPVDAGSIPTGEIRPVAGSPFDFTKPQSIGARIDAADEQITFGAGYDHCWVLGKKRIGDLTRASRLSDPASGRTMDIWTTEPGIQFYAGNFLDGRLVGPGGKGYARRTGLCLEPQHFPDSPNQAQFPSTVLRPGEKYASTSVYKFGKE